MIERSDTGCPTMQREAHQSDLERVVAILRRRSRLIFLCFVLATGSAIVFSLVQRKQYSASASLLFRDPGFDQKLFNSTFQQPNTDPAREAATNVQLVTLETVAAKTSRALGGRPKPTAISNKVSASSEGESNVVSVTATDSQPRFATKLANTFAQEFIAFRRDADQSKVRQAQQLVQSQLQALPPDKRDSDDARALKARADQLQVLAALQTGNAELVQRATVPSSPSSPNLKLNALLGALFGLLIGGGLAVLLERLDKRLRTTEDLEHAYGLTLLGGVPKSRALTSGRGTGPAPAGFEHEAFRMLRARLRYFNVDRHVRSVLVTSYAAEEGKSTIAWHLACTAAMSGGSKVLLLEADMRRPVLAAWHTLDSSPGLAEAITHDIALEEVIQRVAIGPQTNGPGTSAELDVIVAGAIPPNPSEMIESRKMGEILRELTQRYDVVIVDTPPTSLVADSIPLMNQVEGVIVVGRVGQVTRDSAAELREQLAAMGAPALGLVANMVPERGDTYNYGYR